MRYARRRKDSAFYARLFMIVEVVLVFFGFWIGHLYHYGPGEVLTEALLVAFVTVSLFHLVYSQFDMYEALRGRRVSDELVRMLLCWLLIVSGAGLFAFLTKFGVIVSRAWFGSSVVLAFLLVCLFRIAVLAALARAFENGFGSRSIVLVGKARNCRDIMCRLRENRWVGLFPVAVFDNATSEKAPNLADVDVSGSIEDVHDFVEQRRRLGNPVDQVWILLNDFDEKVIFSLVDRMEDSSVDLRLIPNFLGLRLDRDMIEEIADIPVINLSEVRKDRVCNAAKYVFDIVLAAFLLILLAPLMAVIALLIRLDSPGSAIFRQRRYGIDGKEIMIFKFRTMSCSENGTSVVQACKNDQRITRVGRFLRRSSLDELPQFANVLFGDMSIVGPRPHAVSHNEFYRGRIKGYMSRHKIKPGITGWAQVNGLRGETDTIEKMENRVRLDIEYIKNWSMAFDFKIILLTVTHCLFTREAY